MERKHSGGRKSGAAAPCEALIAGLRRLGRERPFESLTVRDIACEAGVSTRTFYNHYRSKYDLVIRFYSWADLAVLRAARAGGPMPDFAELARAGLRRFRCDRAMFAGAFRESVGPESFSDTLLEHAFRTLADFAALRSGSPFPAALAAALRLYCAGFVHVLCEWLDAPAPKSVDAFAADLVSALPAPLRSLLVESTA